MIADQAIQRRRLIRHGFVFLFLALLLGIAITALPHPGRWLAAHLSALLTGLLLIATGVIWNELRLSARQRAIAAGCALTSAYAGIIANIFGAIVDFPGPASDPGVAPPMPQAAVFFTLLAIVVPTILIAIGLGVYGMRGRLPD
jgi:hypothetical protein